MTAERRLAKLEASLTPAELVCRWLDEAHACGDLVSYVRSLLAEPSTEGPLDRLCREAAQGTLASLGSKRPEVVGRTLRSALHETVFRFELVLRINVTVHDLLEREALIEAALAAQLALLTSEDRRTRRADPMCRERLATMRDLVAQQVNELRASQDARAIVEERYLDGHRALFPDEVTAWEEQLKSTEALADLAVRLAELDGVPPAESVDPDALADRTTQLVADLVEPARATALEKLGESQHSLAIAIGWLRPKLEPLRSPSGGEGADPQVPTP